LRFSEPSHKVSWRIAGVWSNRVLNAAGFTCVLRILRSVKINGLVGDQIDVSVVIVPVVESRRRAPWSVIGKAVRAVMRASTPSHLPAVSSPALRSISASPTQAGRKVVTNIKVRIAADMGRQSNWSHSRRNGTRCKTPTPVRRAQESVDTSVAGVIAGGEASPEIFYALKFELIALTERLCACASLRPFEPHKTG